MGMREMITLNADSKPIQYLCNKDKRLAKVISTIGVISYTRHDDPYVFVIHEIIEQMLSVKAANAIFERLQTLCGGNITPEIVAGLSDAEIKTIGTANSKIKYIRSITNTVLQKPSFFTELESLPDAEVYARLRSIHGIGSWTAKMYLLFVLDRQDILPYEDAAFLQSYKWLYKTDDCSPGSIQKRCKKWKPYSSIASRYMYRALDTGLTKEEFHLYKSP